MRFNYFPIVVLIIIVTVFSGCKSPRKGEKTVEPNILFIVSEDLSCYAVSAYKEIYDSVAPTPNIDRLAKEGMIFNNVYLERLHLSKDSEGILPAKLIKSNVTPEIQFNEFVCFPGLMHDAGYQTALFGKWKPDSVPSGIDYYVFHSDVGRQGFYWNPVYNENGVLKTEKGYATNVTTDFALNWLKSAIRGDKPFCLFLNYKAPQGRCEPDLKYENLWKDVEIPVLVNMSPKLNGEDALTDEQEWTKNYLACVKSVDDNVGRILDFLDKKELTENTVVIFTSNQSSLYNREVRNSYRLIDGDSTRIPFLCRFPAQIEAGISNDDLIGNTDIVPTLLKITDVIISDDFKEQNFSQMDEIILN